MAIPDYFRRNAVAISQAISGLDEQRLEARLADVCIGITIGPDAGSAEGRAMADLLVRLLARLYPSLVIHEEGEGGVGEQVSALARRINPRIDLSGQPTIEVVVGTARPRWKTARTVFAGSKSWSARLSTHDPQGCGASNNPFGAGLAACLVAADVFRHVFLPGAELDGECEIAVPNAGEWATDDGDVHGNVGSLVLVGAGAIGNAAAWALSRTRVEGSIEIVDHESVDLGNLQRYVLAERDDEKRPKAPLVAGGFNGKPSASAHECTLAEFLQKKSHKVRQPPTGARLREGSLCCSGVIAPPGSQRMDPAGGPGCFLARLSGRRLRQLPLLAGWRAEERGSDHRGILRCAGPVDAGSDAAVQESGCPKGSARGDCHGTGLTARKAPTVRGRPLRALYTEGFCGGAVIPLGDLGRPASDVHVPLAHQSALAGLLLAAAGVRMGLSGRVESVVTQYDVLKPQERFQVYPAAKHAGERCICQDADYREVYRRKYR